MRWKCFSVVLFLQAVAALPPFQWDTVPTYVHCANMSGPWNAMALDRMTHKGVGFVVFEKVRAFVPATHRLGVYKTRPSVTYNILHISISFAPPLPCRCRASLAAGKCNICIYTLVSFVQVHGLFWPPVNTSAETKIAAACKQVKDAAVAKGVAAPDCYQYVEVDWARTW